MAMPAPIEADPPPAAWPSPSLSACEVVSALSDSAPPLVTRTPAGMIARALAVEIVSEIAAATVIGPPDVEADGVAASPESPAPFAAATPSAELRSAPTWLSTLPLLFVSGAPAALAVAAEDAVEPVDAVSVNVPPALTFVAVLANAVCVANVSAIAAPMAAEPLEVVSPEAVVVADAFVAALPFQSPAATKPGPKPKSAVDETLSIAIATAGAIETPPPLAPVSAFTVVALVELAFADTSSAPLSAMPGSVSARVVMLTMESATAAPMPTLEPPPPPLVPGSAFAVCVEFDVAASVRLPPPA